MFLDIILIAIFVYLGTGFLFALHIGSSHLTARSELGSSWPGYDERARQWLAFAAEQGGVWKLMGKTIVMPWFFLKVEPSTWPGGSSGDDKVSKDA